MPGEANYRNARSRNPTKTLLSHRRITPGGCWEYTGLIDAKGYGVLALPEHEETRVHRIAWRLFVGAFPSGWQINHVCDNPACFNPEHLYPGTQQQNMQDKFARGRANTPYGERCNHKLTAEQVRAIRAATGTHEEAGKRFGVHASTVSRIRAHKRWKKIA